MVMALDLKLIVMHTPNCGRCIENPISLMIIMLYS